MVKFKIFFTALLLLLQSCVVHNSTPFKFFDQLGLRNDQLQKHGVYVSSASYFTDSRQKENRQFFILYKNGASRGHEIISNLDIENPDVTTIENVMHQSQELYRDSRNGWGYYVASDTSFYMKTSLFIFPHEYTYESFGTVPNDSTICIFKEIREKNGYQRDTTFEVSTYQFIRTSYKPDSTFNFSE